MRSSAKLDEPHAAPPQVEAAEGRTPALSRRRRIAVTLGVMTGSFLAALEATVVGTAMPTVVASLGGIERYSWVFSGYLLTSTVTLPLWGKLSDLYGRRRLYQIGIGMFLVGSVLCGLSTSMTQLIVFRTIQGLGAGALIPIGMTIIGDIYSIEERARMQGAFSSVWGVASVLGPLAGGLITDSLSWRWVFLINIPVGVVAAAVIGFALREPRREGRPVIDYAGAVTLTAAITLLLVGLVEVGALGTWQHPLVLSVFATAAVLFAVFVRVERGAREPIVPFGLFRDRTIATSAVCGFLVGVSMFGAISFIPLFVQGVTGASATAAGSALTPLLLAWVLTSIVGGRLMTRVGLRTLVVTGTTLVTVGFAALATFDRGVSRASIVIVMAVIGSGMGLAMLTLLIAVQVAAPRGQLGIVTSLNQFWRSIGGAIGVAVMGAILTASLAARLGSVASDTAARLATDPNAVLDPVARAALAPEVLAGLEAALAQGLGDAFALAACAAALSVVSAFFLSNDRLDSTGR